MTQAKWTTKHFQALDHAVGAGLEVEHNGTRYTLSPLRFRDLGEIIAKGRSLALKAYFDATGLNGKWRDRAREMNLILYGSAAQDSLMDLGNPFIRHAWLKCSLRHKHPQITDEEVDGFFNNAELAERMVSLVARLSKGPAETGGEQEPENPPTAPPSQ